MSEFVKKAALGYRAVPGGQSDPECTHVILTKNEYGELLHAKAQAEQEKRSIQYETDRTIKNAQDSALRKVQQAEAADQHQIEETNLQLTKAKTEIEYQCNLNINLLRISKERANADRHLKPKKEHTGYVVVTSAEKEHRYKSSGKLKSAALWETVLQSPYSVDFTEEQARKQMLDELFREDENGNWLVQKIGITGSYSGGYGPMLSDKDWREIHEQYNIMLDRHLRANFRFGYWEIVFIHTKPLGVIPRDMRARG